MLVFEAPGGRLFPTFPLEHWMYGLIPSKLPHYLLTIYGYRWPGARRHCWTFSIYRHTLNVLTTFHIPRCLILIHLCLQSPYQTSLELQKSSSAKQFLSFFRLHLYQTLLNTQFYQQTYCKEYFLSFLYPTCFLLK